jgi:hypothetical protein
MVTRARSQGPNQPASEAEQALLEERRTLKATKTALKAQPRPPKPKAVWISKEAKAPAAPKAPKAAKAPKDAKGGKGNKPTRAENLTKNAENLDAAMQRRRRRRSRPRLDRVTVLRRPQWCSFGSKREDRESRPRPGAAFHG